MTPRFKTNLSVIGEEGESPPTTSSFAPAVALSTRNTAISFERSRGESPCSSSSTESSPCVSLNSSPRSVDNLEMSERDALQVEQSVSQLGGDSWLRKEYFETPAELQSIGFVQDGRTSSAVYHSDSTEFENSDSEDSELKEDDREIKPSSRLEGELAFFIHVSAVKFLLANSTQMTHQLPPKDQCVVTSARA